MPNRPRSQWIVAGVAAAFLVYPLVVWVGQLVRVLAGCGGGLGNPGVSGRLTGEHCVLSDGAPLVELPWHEDLWITGMLAVSLAGVVVAVLVRRGTVWAALSMSALLLAGLSMGARGHQRAEGELFGYVVVPVEGGGSRALSGGWELNLSGRDIVIPDVGMEPIGVGFLGGLALLALTVMLVRDRRVHPDLI